MVKESCELCKYKKKSDCRRYPPQLIYVSTDISDGYFVSDFPEITDNEWCGEFKPKDK